MPESSIDTKLAAEAALPLAGVRVLDLTLARAGPTCVRHLADWGAEVIRVEPPANGDGFGGDRDGYDFQNLHRNKRSIALNLKSPEGKAALMKLAANADVLVRDPVVLTASLPRFLQPGDQSRMLLEIIHASGPAGEVGLSVTSNGLTLGAVPDRFDLAQNGKAVFRVPLTTRDLGDQTIEVVLTTPDGKLLRKTLTVPVRNNDPAVARVSRFALQQGQSLTLDASIFAGLTPETATATVVSGPLARLNTRM